MIQRQKNEKQFEQKCRVCLEVEEEGKKLLSLPCRCKEELKLIHSDCLSIWAKVKKPEKFENDQILEELFECQICKGQVKIIRKFESMKFRRKKIKKILIDLIFMIVSMLLVMSAGAETDCEILIEEESFGVFLVKGAKLITGIMLGGLSFQDLLSPTNLYFSPHYEIVAIKPIISK